MAKLRAAYLVAGDDDARIDSWRARLRARADGERGPGALETFDARSTSPGEVAAALAALTFLSGTRYVLVDDAGAWRPAELDPLLSVLRDMPPETVLVLIVRGKPLGQLARAVEDAGGEVRVEAAPKPWQVPRWTMERAREEGLQVDQEVASALAAAVGGRQRQIARELEKLALAVHPRTRLTLEDVAELAAGDTVPGTYDLADAVVAGDLSAALSIAERLRAHEERPGRLLFPIARRLRDVEQAARLLDSGIPDNEAARALGAPPWLAKKTVARARKADRAALERAVCALADLEVELRSGELEEDAAFSLALTHAAGGGEESRPPTYWQPRPPERGGAE